MSWYVLAKMLSHEPPAPPTPGPVSEQTPNLCPQCNQPMPAVASPNPQGLASVSKPRWSLLFLLLGIFWYGLMAAVAIFFFHKIFLRPGPADFTAYKDQVKVSEAWLHREQSDRDGHVTILGHIRNDSSVKWEQPYFEVQCFNHEGKLVDTYAAYDMGLVLLPDTQHAFRITFTPTSPPVHWTEFKVYLRDARDARGWLR